MSHELHTPLNAILGFCQVMDTAERQPEDAENVRQILAAGRHLLHLVDALLGIAGSPGATLPDAAATPVGRATLAPPPEGAGSRHQMVLYVEDNEANLRLMKRVLARRPGIALLHTSLGQRGVELAREHRPNLILLDLHLPDLSGVDVLARILRDPVTRETPVVIVSADATTATSERLLRAGATDFLVKPFQLARLLSVIDRLVDERPSAAGDTT
jgi:CheY-like chemotaxis protein